VEGTRRVLEAALGAGVKRFVHLSTAAIHDCAGLDTFDETAPELAAADLSYEAAKLAAERIVEQAAVSAIVLRPTVVYGPWGRDWTERPIRRLIQDVQGLPTGPDTGVSNAIYVDDVVQAIIRSCASAATGPMLVASDEVISWGSFYDALRAHIVEARSSGDAKESVEEWEEDLYRQNAKANIGKAQRLLGYQPRVSFARGMSMVTAWSAWYGLAPSA
jgi:nucleoside-diphosphate-sugar epimerase